MPLYQYTAMDSNGKEQKGKKEAGSEEEVATFLKNQGLFPTSIKSATKGGGGKGGKGGGGGKGGKGGTKAGAEESQEVSA